MDDLAISGDSQNGVFGGSGLDLMSCPVEDPCQAQLLELQHRDITPLDFDTLSTLDAPSRRSEEHVAYIRQVIAEWPDSVDSCPLCLGKTVSLREVPCCQRSACASCFEGCWSSAVPTRPTPMDSKPPLESRAVQLPLFIWVR